MTCFEQGKLGSNKCGPGVCGKFGPEKPWNSSPPQTQYAAEKRSKGIVMKQSLLPFACGELTFAIPVEVLGNQQDMIHRNCLKVMQKKTGESNQFTVSNREYPTYII
jgi:hypothetical protein